MKMFHNGVLRREWNCKMSWALTDGGRQRSRVSLVSLLISHQLYEIWTTFPFRTVS